MPKAKISAISSTRPIDAYQLIRQRIVALEYAPGVSLDEKSIVDELGLSRTPVREALIRLSGEGLVEIEKNKGARVSELDLPTLQSIFEAGDLIERAYTRLACLRRTEEDVRKIKSALHEFEEDLANGDVNAMVISNTAFHLDIAAASKNKYFLDAYRRVLADHERIAQLWYSDIIDQHNHPAHKTTCQQHRDLFAAIVDRDADRAEQVSIAHANTCKEGIRVLLSRGEALIANLQVNPDSFTLHR